MVMGALATPPADDEIEVSLFGPGFGECVVVHLTGGDWMVVDSCLESAAGRPVALQYLEDLGVDVATRVKLVVVTHWHADHIEGAAEVLRACRSAKFACSAALRCAEFLKLVIIHDEISRDAARGMEEFADLFAVLQDRRGSGPDYWASAAMRLLQDEHKGPRYQVWALSPSADSQTIALRDFSRLLDQANDPNRRLPSRSPNEYSVVLWVDIAGFRVLLGADLENDATPGRGWNAVLGSSAWSDGRARVFKVPHHGSSNADHPDVWRRMLFPRPVAVLTPYARGGRPLPGPRDVERLRERTDELYSTGDPAKWRQPRRSRPVERSLSEAVKHRRVLRGPAGHVQVRWKTDGTQEAPAVRLAGGAIKLS